MKNNNFSSLLLVVFLFLTVSSNIFSFENKLDIENKIVIENKIDIENDSNQKMPRTSYNLEIMGIGCVNLLLFDKIEPKAIYFNGFSPSVKIIFRENRNLGLGIEFSPFIAKKSTLVSNLNSNESIQGEYFVQPIILSFNYKITNFNVFFGFGISKVQSNLFLDSEIISPNPRISSVYNYGIDYSYEIKEYLFLGIASKVFYHSDIEKFNLQTGIFIKYNFSF